MKTPELLAELKAYASGLYTGQYVLRFKNSKTVYNLNAAYFPASTNDMAYLQLRALSAITDDEAIGVGFMTAAHFNRCMDVYNEAGENRFYNEFIGNNIVRYQQLQQSGFALPIFFKGVQYSVETLQALGIIQLTTT